MRELSWKVDPYTVLHQISDPMTDFQVSFFIRHRIPEIEYQLLNKYTASLLIEELLARCGHDPRVAKMTRGNIERGFYYYWGELDQGRGRP